jgi:hypothetical protein
MKRLCKRTNPSDDDRFCPDMPDFIVSVLLHGQALRIIRPLRSAIKFVL